LEHQLRAIPYQKRSKSQKRKYGKILEDLAKAESKLKKAEVNYDESHVSRLFT